MAKCGIILGIVVLASVTAILDAGAAGTMECYICSADQPQCLKPGADMKQTCSADNETFCWKSVTKVGSGQAASRGCGKYRGIANVSVGDDECKETEVTGAKVTVCNCNKSGCNGEEIFDLK
ncbi:uncharacterized protein LOC129591959 [Paramacrobiotus metropolitanus]|uniref:uncharacterized protein LOC129591959 n=1 Tax=Paramacrobiotus metropolitanus TaxID=2943436 RepID=UPI002445C83D|nr:uncharacterized protein LOC129591959 [Paramacrobiotus metropolitanus]